MKIIFLLALAMLIGGASASTTANYGLHQFAETDYFSDFITNLNSDLVTIDENLGTGGDVTTVQPTGTNDQTALNAAIAQGGIISLADGTYDIGGTVYINRSNVTITGSKLAVFNVRCATGIRVDLPDGDRSDAFKLEGFTIYTTTNTTGTIGINVINTTDGGVSVIDYMTIHGFQKQIAFSGQGTWPLNAATGMHTISDCIIGKYDQIGPDYGIFCERGIGLEIHDNKITGYDEAGIHLERCDSSHIRDNEIIAIGQLYLGGKQPTYGIHVYPHHADQLVVDLHIEGNAIEQVSNAIMIESASPPIFQVWIEDNEINGYENGIIVAAAGGAQDRDLYIKNNDLLDSRKGTDGRPIWVVGMGGVHIDSNNVKTVGTTDGFSIRFTASGGNGNTIIGNSIDHGSGTVNEGIYAGAPYTAIIGNTMVGSGTRNERIQLSADCDYCTVVGNTGVAADIVDGGTGNVKDHNT
jgi:hypothetical protein